MITASFVDAIKVQFIKPIFEDDFVEKGDEGVAGQH